MKGVLLKDSELIRIFDRVDDDVVGAEFLRHGVNLNSYRVFMSGRSNYVYSPDGRIELREVTDDQLRTIVQNRIEKVEKELYWLKKIKEDCSGRSD